MSVIKVSKKKRKRKRTSKKMEVDPRDTRLHDSLDGLDGIEDSLIDEPLFHNKNKRHQEL